MNMNRFIKAMKVTLVEDNGEEPLVRFELHGQSFIYHQIRNMVGSIIQIMQRPFSLKPCCKNAQSGIQNLTIDQLQDLLNETFKDQKVNIWLAPSQGLYLQDLYFSNYNRRGNIPESLELTTEENQIRNDWCEEHIVKYVKEWARGEEDVKSWLFNNVKWDTLERIEGKEKQQAWKKKTENMNEKMVEEKQHSSITTENNKANKLN